MSSPALAHKVGKRVCEILGISSNLVFNVEIRMNVNELVTVTIQRLISQSEASAIAEELEQYTLVQKLDVPNVTDDF
jgi:hypothetical protein